MKTDQPDTHQEKIDIFRGWISGLCSGRHDAWKVELLDVLIFNEASAQADRDSFAELSAMLETALPNFRGCPAPDDWAKAALRELIAQRAELVAALEAMLKCNKELGAISRPVANDARAILAKVKGHV